MKKYVCAILSFFDNDIKQFKIEADSEYEAAKKAILESFDNEDSKLSEMDFQNSADYPQDFKTLETMLHNGDTVISVIEVTAF
jgi:hypothetical protein